MTLNNISAIEDPAFFKTVLNTVNDGVSVVDKEFRILYQNKKIDLLFGNNIGQCCYKVYRNRETPCEDCVIDDIFTDGLSRTTIRDILLPNGKIMWVESNVSPFRNTHGKIIGMVEAVRDVTEHIRLTEENCTLRRELQRKAQFENIITQSKKMKDIFRLIERVASTTSTVLISGESGTGKELIAKAILVNSNRKDKPFVTVNCGAIPENLLESELFGHVKGSFTGAVKNHNGLIEMANEGTLFLDEIGEVPASLQVKLLRFLQEGESRKVGGTKTLKFNVRIISATNKNLEDEVEKGNFREDLFFRLSIIPISLPPLRERKEDIPLLADHLLQKLCETHKRSISGISSESLRLFMEYPWSGNIRELENVIEYAIHLTDDGEPIREQKLPPNLLKKKDEQHFTKQFISVNEFTKSSILALAVNHSEKKIAQILGISRKNLWEKRKRWGLIRSKKEHPK